MSKLSTAHRLGRLWYVLRGHHFLAGAPGDKWSGDDVVDQDATLVYAAGLHHPCATATGRRCGESGTSADCVDVTVKAPPTVTVGHCSGNAGDDGRGNCVPDLRNRERRDDDVG